MGGQTNYTLYISDGFDIVAVANQSAQILETFTRGPGLGGDIGTLVAVTHHAGSTTTGTFYIQNNHRGDVVLTRSGTTTVGSCDYSAFGALKTQTGTDVCRFKFSSKERDGSTGFSYYGYRFYAPQWQRWLNRDSIGERGGINLYAYVGNNPINYIDPVGLINWMTEWWADLSLTGSWWQRPIATTLGPLSAMIPDSVGWSASQTVGLGNGVTSGYNTQAFISKPCPHAAQYNLIGPIVGTPQATVDAQVSLGWSVNSSDNSGTDSWSGWFTGFQLGIGPYVVSASLGNGWFNFTYGVGGPPGITFQSFATYYDLVQHY